MSKNMFGDLFKINKPVTAKAKNELDYYASENARRRRQTNTPSVSVSQNNTSASAFDNSNVTSYTYNTSNPHGFDLWKQPVYKPQSFEEQKQKNEQVFAEENSSYASSQNAPQKQEKTEYKPSYSTANKPVIPKLPSVDPAIARTMRTQAEYQDYLSGNYTPKSEYRKEAEKYLGRELSETELNAYMRHPLNMAVLEKEYEVRDKPKKSGRIQNAVNISNSLYSKDVIPSPAADYDITDAYKDNTNGVKHALDMWYNRIIIAPYKGKYWFNDMIEAQEQAEAWLKTTYGNEVGRLLYNQLHQKISNTTYDERKKLDDNFREYTKDDLIPMSSKEFVKKYNVIKGPLGLGKGPIKIEPEPLPDRSEEGHQLLDVLGLFPGGEVFDGLNSWMYYKEGDYLNAALSGISVLGAVGDTIGKGGKGLKGFDNAFDISGNASAMIKNALKSLDEVADGADIALDLTKLPITEKGLADKMPLDLYKEARRTSLKNADAASLTLGKYTGGADSYIARAGSDSSYFDLGSQWDEIKHKYGFTNAQMFEYFNIPVLDDAIKKGKVIRFSHDPRMYESGALTNEWEYIKEILKLTDNDLVYKGGFWYVK